MRTPITRLGLVALILGLSLAIAGAVAITYHVRQSDPPPRAEFLAAWHAQEAERNREEMARILADVPQPEPTNEAEAAQRVAQRMTDNMGPPFDYGAKWTDATYVPAVRKAISDALRFPGDTAEKALWRGCASSLQAFSSGYCSNQR